MEERYMRILFLILIFINFGVCIFIFAGLAEYRPACYKVGLRFYRRRLKIQKNHIVNDIGKEIEKNELDSVSFPNAFVSEQKREVITNSRAHI